MESSKTLIRAVIALFAAVVGFGLKALLDVDPAVAPEVFAHRWPFFVILLLLAFRIVCGASVHLAELYAEKVTSARRITADLFMLMIFAVAILQVVDATTTAGFLLRLLAPNVVLVVWALMDHLEWKHPLGNLYFLINSGYLFAVGLIYGVHTSEAFASPFALFGWSGAAVALLVVSVAAAVFDVHFQMRHLVANRREAAAPTTVMPRVV